MEHGDSSPQRAQQKMLQVHGELTVHVGVAVRPLTGGRGSELTDELTFLENFVFISEFTGADGKGTDVRNSSASQGRLNGRGNGDRITK